MIIPISHYQLINGCYKGNQIQEQNLTPGLTMNCGQSATITSCKDLLNIIDESSLSNFPVFFFDDHPKVARTIEICRVLRGDTTKDKEISLEERALIDAMKHFENSKDPSSCTLIAFKGQKMRKEIKKFTKSRKRVRSIRNARSIKTVGPCKWMLFKRRNFKGDTTTLDGDTEYNQTNDWGWIPGQIRSMKLISL
uniref:Beta/gamma crystallin 'Greek key' domain-containing protein n=1 Tax=Lepeophtheirus salmonis TaxID=72036 RepID=A0A0K2U7Z3_LEPSM